MDRNEIFLFARTNHKIETNLLRCPQATHSQPKRMRHRGRRQVKCFDRLWWSVMSLRYPSTGSLSTLPQFWSSVIWLLWLIIIGCIRSTRDFPLGTRRCCDVESTSGPFLTLDPFSAGTVFIRQNLTSVDVRFWRIKSIRALKELKYLQWSHLHNIGIQINRKELTKTFKMIYNWFKPMIYTKLFQRCKC